MGENQGLNVVDVFDSDAVDLGLDHLQKLAVQALDQQYRIQINLFHGSNPFWLCRGPGASTKMGQSGKNLFNANCRFSPK